MKKQIPINNNLLATTKPCVIQKDTASGEKELFELAYNAKQEVSWAHVRGAHTWINLTSDYRRTISKTAMEYQVSSRQLANTIFDAFLTFYHTHPKKAFDDAYKLITGQRWYDRFVKNIEKELLHMHERACGHLLGTFHLPSVADIEAAAYLEERHGPGTVHVIISNVGATVTWIRNPPPGKSDKASIDELIHMYKRAHQSIPQFQQGNVATYDILSLPPVAVLMAPQYGVINDQCDGRIMVADLTSIASIKMRPMDYLLMRWLSAETDVQEQFLKSRVRQVMRIVGTVENGTELETKVKELSAKRNNALELDRLSAMVHSDVADILAKVVGRESCIVYADYTMKALGGYYDCVLANT